jgi:hypothetical protein
LELTRNDVVLAIVGGGVIVGALALWVISRGGDSSRFPIPGEGERVVVEVLNTTLVDDLARTVTGRLRRAGIDVVYYGSSDERLDSTLILIRRGDSSFVDRIRTAIGGGRVIMDTDEGLLLDASVLLGLDVAPLSDIEP